ncbi:MAG: glycosyltransferase [Actinomycetota bacterium]
MITRRILFLVDSLGIGGAERGLVLTLRFLNRDYIDGEVASLWEPMTLRRDIEALGIPVHALESGRGPRALLQVPRLVRLLRRGRFDAIHTQVVWSSIAGRIAGRIARVKVISHVLNADPHGRDQAELPRVTARKAQVVALLDELTGRFLVDRFVAISQAAAKNPIRGRSWDRSRFSVVARGQPLEELARRAAEDPHPAIENPGRPSILSVGRLAPQKGHRYLIDAMPKILAEYPGAVLLIAGDGYSRPVLEQRARPLGKSVTFLGIRSDVPSLLSRCDVFVFPSLWEGQGNALLEAMAVGGPIVATRIPAIEETLRHGEDAWLVDPANSEALAEGVLRMMADPAMAASMAKRAALASGRFDIHRTTMELESLYRDVLG